MSEPGGDVGPAVDGAAAGDRRAGGDRLRVALIAGTLGQAGAEKQLVYMARALRDAGAEPRVYTLEAGGYHEASLEALGVPTRWVGRRAGPPLRIAALTAELRRFRPHVAQAIHFYCNLYAGTAGRLAGAVPIGGLRNVLDHEHRPCGRWVPWLLRATPALIANSRAAQGQVREAGRGAARAFHVANVIDLDEFDAAPLADPAPWGPDEGPVVAAVGRMYPAKRFDRFLTALARARRRAPNLRGAIVGDGPGMDDLRRQAGALGLGPDALILPGRRNDVPAVLRRASFLAMTSDYEGFPNVVLEAMAARLPVVATPAGDAGAVVEEGVTGFVVPREDGEALAERMARLADDPGLRRRLGEAGRRRAEADFGLAGLADRLADVYREVAGRRGRRDVLAALDRLRATDGRPEGGGLR